MLTKRQKQIFDYVVEYRNDHGYSPSLEEIASHFKLRSVATIHEHLENIRSKGYLKKEDNHARAIAPDESGGKIYTTIPLLGTISAGNPIEPIVEEEKIQVLKSMLSKTGNHYALRVEGDSMIDEGILNGDTIIVKEQKTIENGKTGVAYLPENNEVTLKKIFREKNRIRLQPANPKLKPRFEKNVEIQGRVCAVLRNV